MADITGSYHDTLPSVSGFISARFISFIDRVLMTITLPAHVRIKKVFQRVYNSDNVFLF